MAANYDHLVGKTITKIEDIGDAHIEIFFDDNTSVDIYAMAQGPEVDYVELDVGVLNGSE